MIKVLHVAENVQGGIASYLSELVIAQSKAYGADNVRFLLPVDQMHQVAHLKARQIATFQRIGRGLKGLFQLYKEVKRVYRDEQPDVIHCHAGFAGAAVRMALWGNRRVKIVYCPHGWAFRRQLPNWKKKLYLALEKFFAAQTDLIINISKDEHRAALEAGLPKAKMVTIANGTTPLQMVAGQEVPKKEAEKTFLFMGRFNRHKGLDKILPVFDQLKDENVHLNVLGAPINTNDWPKVGSNVTLHGWLPRHKIAAFIQQADAIIVPSRWEGFGLVAIEAMSLSTAVIGSDRGALPEIIDEGHTGFIFNLKEPQHLARLIRETSTEQFAEMGKAGLIRFREKYSAERLNNDLLEAYEGLAGEKA